MPCMSSVGSSAVERSLSITPERTVSALKISIWSLCVPYEFKDFGGETIRIAGKSFQNR